MGMQQFVAEMEARLKDLDGKLARPRPKNGNTRMEREKTGHALKAKRDMLRDQLQEATAAPDDGWHRLKASGKRVYEDMVRHMGGTCARIDGPENAGLY